MGSLIWTIIVVFAAESFGVFGQADVQLPSFDSTQIEAFKKFLQKSLSSDGTYNRYLLVSTGILPAPTNYDATPRANGAEMSTDQPLFDFYDHFMHYAEEILTSEEKINDALFKLFSVGALDKVIDSESNSFLSLDPTKTLSDSADDLKQSDWLSNYSSDVDIVDFDPDQQIDLKNTQYEVISETSPDSHLIESTSPETGSFATEYKKFLTDEYPESSSTNYESEDKINQKDQCTTGTVFLEKDLSSIVSSITEDYKQFLKASSKPIDVKSAFATDGTESTEDYSTDSFSSAAYETDASKQREEYSTDYFSSYISTINNEESSFSNSEDTYVSQDATTDYVILKLWPTTVETEKTSYLSTEDFTHTSQSKNYEDVTYNQNTEFLTIEPETKFDSSQTESGEASSPSLRVAKGIRQGKEDGSSLRVIVRGTPGIQYPNYEDIPDKEFNCKDKTHIPGFYADMETRCQVFHVCWPGRRESFLCPIGTIFNQAILACDYWYNSNCSVSSAYFDVNAAFKEVDTTKPGMTGPMIDTLIKDAKKTSVVPDEIISSSGEISELYEADVHFSETVAKHELSKIWKFLPIKAKIFIQPQLNLEDIIGKTKLKRSKKGIAEEREHTNDKREDISEVRKQSKENVESIILNVLKNLIQS